MRTRFWKLTALMLALMLALTGCSLIEIDQEMDMAEVVAKVNGAEITKGDVIDQYNYMLNYYDYYYSYYGLTFDSETAEMVKDGVLDMYIEQELVSQKAKELNLSDLSDESFAEADAEAAASFEDLIVEHSSHIDTEGMTEEAARAAVIEHMNGDGITLESVIEDHRTLHLIDLVREYVVADVTVTDDELQTAYDEKVAADEETYSASSYSYEQSQLNGETIAWNPEGYRTVKHILFLTTEEQDAELAALEDQLSEVEDAIDALNSEDAADAASSDETASDDTAEAPKTLDELNTEKAALEQAIVDKKAEIIASFSDKVQSVNDRLAAGESFDALMAELGEDPGMKQEPAMTTGYYVSAASIMWDTNFRDTAMALANVGDVSEPVLSASGVHIIYYNSDVPAGAVALEELSDALSAELLAAKKDEVYAAQYEEWLKNANVKKYPKVLP